MNEVSVTRQVADNIRTLRSQRHWSARQLAEQCARAGATSLTRGTIAKIESGVRKHVTAHELAVLAQVFGVGPSELLIAATGRRGEALLPSFEAARLPADMPGPWGQATNAGGGPAGVAGLSYRLLGELEIGRYGEDLELPGGQTLVVLAALLLNANRRVSKATLISAVWGADEMDESLLHKRVAAVRDLLDQIGRRADLRTHPRFGYEMRVAENDVDVLLFHRLLREADEADADLRSDDEVDRLRRALRLWRGPHPLSNVPTGFFRQETAELEQRHRRAATRMFDLEIARGHYEIILDELIRIAGFYPVDRRLCEQLMVAEYRCGRLADAIRPYERYREALAEETAAQPDPLLRALYMAIAEGDDETIAVAESTMITRAGTANRAATSVRPAVTVPRQLPPAADLVGRQELLAEVARLLHRLPGPAAPVVVISGPGGIGKTALALRAAHDAADRYPDGQLFMDLHGIAGGAPDISEVLAQFLRALGALRIPETKAERLAEYRTLLAGRQVLIVLDDAAEGAHVSELVPANPASAVLVTSRQRLPEVSGAYHVARLGPLDEAGATELFLRLVRDAGIHFENEPDAVGRVVMLCGGLPLALRIAAALRVRDHPRPTSELADRLAGQGPAAFAYRQFSVERTISAGFERLDAPSRQLFLELGLLPLTRFGLWTAAALLGAEADWSAALLQLAANFMIEPVDSGIRYRFHELTREYSRRRALAEYQEGRDEIPSKAYRAFLTLARRAHRRLYGGDFEVVHSDIPDWDAPPGVLAEVDASPLEWFEQERSNIRAAVRHCAALGLSSICWDLAVSAHEFYTIRGYFDDWYATHTVALDACRKAGDSRGEGIVLACLHQPALVASRRSRAVAVQADLLRAVELLAECGDRHGQAIALRTLASALRRQGHLTRPLNLLSEALAHYTACEDTVGQWQALRVIGQIHLDLGQHDDARRVLEAARTVASDLGGDRLIAQTRYWIGQVCLVTNDLDGARAAFSMVLNTFPDEAGIGHAYARHGLGDLACREGAYDLADQHLTMAAELARDGADAFLEGRVRLSIAALRQATGQLHEQGVELRRAVSTFAGCSAAHLESRALATLAETMTARGRNAAADATWTRVEALAAAADLPESDRLYARPDS